MHQNFLVLKKINSTTIFTANQKSLNSSPHQLYDGIYIYILQTQEQWQVETQPDQDEYEVKQKKDMETIAHS